MAVIDRAYNSTIGTLFSANANTKIKSGIYHTALAVASVAFSIHLGRCNFLEGTVSVIAVPLLSGPLLGRSILRFCMKAAFAGIALQCSLQTYRVGSLIFKTLAKTNKPVSCEQFWKVSYFTAFSLLFARTAYAMITSTDQKRDASNR